MEVLDKKIRIVRPHAQGAGGSSTEIIIPKDLCDRYSINPDVHVMLIPQKDFFIVTTLKTKLPFKIEDDKE